MGYNFDEDLLRHDLLDYYGTAAFNGFPVAMMDVFAVQKMNSDELWSQAQRNGFRMEKYTSPVSSSIPYNAFYSGVTSGSFSYVKTQTVERKSSQSEIVFPTYENAVPDSYFRRTEDALAVMNQRPQHWGHLFLAHELRGYLYQLGKLKKQTPGNPYVEKIGNDSEGRPLLYFVVGFSENLVDAVNKAENSAAKSIASFESTINKAERRKKPDLITDYSIELLYPYKVFLGLYNDIELVDAPAEYAKIFSEMRKIVKSLLSDCELFCSEIYSGILTAIENGDNIPSSFSLKLRGFYSKKLSDSVIAIISSLLESKIMRKRISRIE